MAVHLGSDKYWRICLCEPLRNLVFSIVTGAIQRETHVTQAKVNKLLARKKKRARCWKSSKPKLFQAIMRQLSNAYKPTTSLLTFAIKLFMQRYHVAHK